MKKGDIMNSETIRRYARVLGVALIACLLAVIATGCSGRRSQQQAEIGNTFLGLGKFAEARQAFEKALAMDPGNMEAELGLARCLAAQDNLEAALEHYQTVIGREPSIGAAYEEAVPILLRRERTADATELANAYEKVNPLKGGLLKAFILRTTDQTDEAVTLLENLSRTFPESADVRISLASSYMSAGDDAKAIEILESVLETLDPDSLSARMKLVEVYQKQGKIDEIIEQFREMVDQNPDDVGLQLALARSLINKGEYDEAEEIGRAVLTELPESGWANYVVGACLLAREQRKQAIPYLQTAAQALPNFEIVREHLAMARSQQAGETGSEEAETPPADETPAPSPDVTPVEEASWQTLWKQAQLDELLRQSDTLLASEEPNLRETLVLAALFSGERARARQLAEALPADSPLSALLAALEEKKPEAVVNVFDSWTETDPKRAILRDNAYGFALMLVGARAKAMQELSACYAKSPENAVALYNLATLYRTAQLPQYAAQVLDRLLVLYPNNLGARRLLLTLLVENGDLERARGVAELTYQLYPTNSQSVLDAARVYRITGQLDLAESILRNALATMPENG
ncbi:MAG: tetratricopeptide repeat protein, partial [Candidatus Hydrogenedentota bacterium]